MNTPIFARDIAQDKLNDTFFGKGFEALLKEAEEHGGRDVIVGYFLKKPRID